MAGPTGPFATALQSTDLNHFCTKDPGFGIACQTTSASQIIFVLLEDFFGTGMAQGVTVLRADANDSLLCVTCSHSVNAVNILLAL